MSGPPDPPPLLDDPRRLYAAVAVVAVLALLARFVGLGSRPAHWDEARVGYWILDYIRTGAFEYRAIIHGPFIHHANRVVFAVLEPNDFTMRIVPALIGGLMPLSALLLRDRLRPIETVALAGFLAFSPILLYYSRFMRGDLMLAAFMFAAFACFVRAVDTGKGRFVVAGMLLSALGFTVKENALLYVLCWLGGLALVFDTRLYVSRYREAAGASPDGGAAPVTARGDWTDVFVADIERAARGVRGVLPSVLVGAVGFLLVIVFMYAPRTPVAGGVGINQVVATPGVLPAVLEEALIGSAEEYYGTWINSDLSESVYTRYLGALARDTAAGALAVSIAGTGGFLIERYAAEKPRPLVMLAFYWALASFLGYPAVVDQAAAGNWTVIHVAAPMAIPAAVGVAYVVRWGQDAFRTDDRTGVGLAALVLLLVVALVAWSSLSVVYLNPTGPDNEVVQYAQPRDDIQPEMAALDRLADGEGTDVLLYGTFMVQEDPPETSEFYPACSDWFNALPLPWYYTVSDATVDCARTAEALPAANETAPPVVIAKADEDVRIDNGSSSTFLQVPEELEERFPGYDASIKRIRTTDTPVVFLIDRDRLPADSTGLREPDDDGAGGDRPPEPALSVRPKPSP
jgi:uncharacterized protein (TIGR03663 family)